jgi:transcriptional regulator CtsR
VVRVFEAALITEREAAVMQAALKRDILLVDLPERDKLRARLLRAMMTAAFERERENL